MRSSVGRALGDNVEKKGCVFRDWVRRDVCKGVSVEM